MPDRFCWNRKNQTGFVNFKIPARTWYCRWRSRWGPWSAWGTQRIVPSWLNLDGRERMARGNSWPSATGLYWPGDFTWKITVVVLCFILRCYRHRRDQWEITGWRGCTDDQAQNIKGGFHGERTRCRPPPRRVPYRRRRRRRVVQG
jgi:hypothetical protein